MLANSYPYHGAAVLGVLGAHLRCLLGVLGCATNCERRCKMQNWRSKMAIARCTRLMANAPVIKHSFGVRCHSMPLRAESPNAIQCHRTWRTPVNPSKHRRCAPGNPYNLQSRYAAISVGTKNGSRSPSIRFSRSLLRLLLRLLLAPSEHW